MASKAAYGANPNTGVNVNADHGWGGYQWPAGVPANLLGTTSYQQVNGLKQVVRVTVRRELVPLFELAAAIADRKYQYQIFVTGPDGKPWGPWSYENRAIGGTTSPSNHSRAKAWDVNAPNNPQSFIFQSDMPPGLVADWESIGLCWGGRYGGNTKFDTMHFEYGYSPSDVAGHIALAGQILGRQPAKPNPSAPSRPAPTTPAPPPIDLEVDMLNVIRDKVTGVDYLLGAPFVFVMIENEQAYNRYVDAKMIDVPHGQAPAFEPFEVAWYREKIVAWRSAAGLPGAGDVEPVFGYTPAN